VRIEFESAVLYPACSKIALMNSVVDDLPSVPVTPMTVNVLEGNL
jgi:hypothetical protein